MESAKNMLEKKVTLILPKVLLLKVWDVTIRIRPDNGLSHLPHQT